MAEEKTNKSKLAEKEEEILKFWQAEGVFEKSLTQSEGKKEFVFYEGPPTANGKPGIHHLEARAYKDVIPRYKTMRGFHVRRKGGWDTHGLPVELQVEKELGLKSKKEIESFGVAEFNKKCKESVWRYVDLWEKFTDRIGYWVDQKDPYITYKNEYIEAVWNVIKKADDKKLLYKDYKVVPWCPRCGTGLSSHELAQGYQDVKDTSVTIKFKIKGQENTYMLAWTTTPWTLPGNVALAVGEKIDYVKIKIFITHPVFERVKNGEDLKAEPIPSRDEFFILAKNRLSIIKDKYEIVEEMKGKDLIGLEYEQLFPYAEKFASATEKEKLGKAFKVYPADFVTTEDGTGVVHTAVMYGQDDFVLGNEVGLPKIHMVDENGKFKEGMDFLSGRFVKEKDEKGKPTLDIDILNYLKEKGFYFSDEPHLHSYPFCWRCDTPLIYYARDSWYIKMSDLRHKLVKENEEINWIPAHIKEGRFGEWLREVKDWAISRERYWGSPLPVWQDDKGERFVIGSIDELKKHTKKSGNKYFVMRHGEAKNNVHVGLHTKDLDESQDAKLTDNGMSQVLESLKGFNEKVDIVVSSPYARARQTTEMVCKHINFPLEKVIEEKKVQEWETSSIFEGKDRKIFKQYYDNDFAGEPLEILPGGESFAQLVKRIGDFLYSLETKFSNKNIFIVCHSGSMRAMDFIVRGLSFGELSSENNPLTLPDNAEIRKLDFTPLPHNENYELDLHKPFIDQIELVDKNGKELKRAKEVLDVWFDSGGMPFAQDGLNPKEMPYPADFICEAIDQTRGWFYTLHAIGVLMGKGKAFKNVICLGHILDAKGIKMSKHIGNVVDPWEMIDKYSADALRMWMYTVNQPGDSKNFDEKTVDEVVKKVFNLASNILSFYEMYKDEDIKPSEKSKNVLDRWIVSKLNELLKDGGKFLDEYKVFEAARLIRDFVNDFSTWYIRRSRDRFKSEDIQDRNDALATTYFVLIQMAKYMAPFMPFFAENLYQKLRSEKDPESVHLCEWPEAGKIDKDLITTMSLARSYVAIALAQRNQAGIKVRQPLKELSIKHDGPEFKYWSEIKTVVEDEINVKRVEFVAGDKTDKPGIFLNTEITPELQKEGNVREIVRAIQELRKNKNLVPQDIVELLVETDEVGKEFLDSVATEIRKPTNVSQIKFEANDGTELEVGDLRFKIKIK